MTSVSPDTANKSINPSTKTSRFYWLDAGRGLAAIAVMLYHFEEWLGTTGLFKFGFIAVDLFFMMSGFVLVHAYGQKLQNGLSTTRFLVLRLLRLYPTYFLATGFGLTYYLVKIVLQTDDAPMVSDLAAITLQNLVFLPNGISGLNPAGIFPFAPTSWSLSAEMLVSVVYVLGVWRFKNSSLIFSMVLFSAVSLFFALRFGTFDYGFDSRSFNSGLFRATAEFCIGVWLYKRFGHIRINAQWASPAMLLMIVFLLVVVKPSLWVSCLAIGVLFPAFLSLHSANVPHQIWVWICNELGRISYPVYLLHAPILLWGLGTLKMLGVDAGAVDGPWVGIMLIVATISLSWLAAKCFDEPVRNYLKTRFLRPAAGA